MLGVNSFITVKGSTTLLYVVTGGRYRCSKRHDSFFHINFASWFESVPYVATVHRRRRYFGMRWLHFIVGTMTHCPAFRWRRPLHCCYQLPEVKARPTRVPLFHSGAAHSYLISGCNVWFYYNKSGARQTGRHSAYGRRNCRESRGQGLCGNGSVVSVDDLLTTYKCHVIVWIL